MNSFVSEYAIGQIVYLKTDVEQLPRMVINIQFTQTSVLYKVINCTVETWHYPIEISATANEALRLNLKTHE